MDAFAGSVSVVVVVVGLYVPQELLPLVPPSSKTGAMYGVGHGIGFPREKWPTTNQRSKFSRTGLYILSGYKDGADDLPTIYIGEPIALRNSSHAA